MKYIFTIVFLLATFAQADVIHFERGKQNLFTGDESAESCSKILVAYKAWLKKLKKEATKKGLFDAVLIIDKELLRKEMTGFEEINSDYPDFMYVFREHQSSILSIHYKEQIRKAKIIENLISQSLKTKKHLVKRGNISEAQGLDDWVKSFKEDTKHFLKETGYKKRSDFLKKQCRDLKNELGMRKALVGKWYGKTREGFEFRLKIEDDMTYTISEKYKAKPKSKSSGTLVFEARDSKRNIAPGFVTEDKVFKIMYPDRRSIRVKKKNNKHSFQAMKMLM